MSFDTILVTGAGFSAPAGIPSQKELLERLSAYDPGIETPGAVEFLEAKMRVRDFVESFFSPGRTERPWHSVPLEDVYTVLDRALIEGDSLPPFSIDDIWAVRRSLDSCIARYLIAVIENADDSLYCRLVNRLIELYGLNWATATTNWDVLWDRVLLNYYRRIGLELSYGAHVFEANDEMFRPVNDNGGGPVLYKLHGSLDWLICPCCHSVFAVSDLRLTDPFLSNLKCPRCGDHTCDSAEPRLRSVLLTPTMLKTVTNPTMRIIYDEVFHALKKASRVIFVGYSLPEADHDLRYLFRRAIGKYTDVKVVLKGPETGPIISRYKQLFGLGDEDFFCDGFEAFFSL